jgi:hypothetical protein
MLGIVFAQCWIHSLSPFVTGQTARLAFGLRRASLQRLRKSMAITSSCSTQKACWLLSLSLKRLKAGMKYEIEFRMDDQAVLLS